jgi:hypothetical protein
MLIGASCEWTFRAVSGAATGFLHDESELWKILFFWQESQGAVT